MRVLILGDLSDFLTSEELGPLVQNIRDDVETHVGHLVRLIKVEVTSREQLLNEFSPVARNSWQEGYNEGFRDGYTPPPGATGNEELWHPIK